VPDPGDPDGRPTRVRKRARVRVRVERTRGQKVRSWWRRNWRTVLIVGWFVVASLVLAALVLMGYLRPPAPPPPA
jgi:ABC-type Fe3+ transport system permease subunit